MPLLMYYHCYGNLKFPLAYYEKSESRPYLLSLQIFFFTEMFLEYSSTKPIIFVQFSEFNWLPWQPKI